jgi:hypothetical protein
MSAGEKLKGTHRALPVADERQSLMYLPAVRIGRRAPDAQALAETEQNDVCHD